jgi:hypothetical protein
VELYRSDTGRLSILLGRQLLRKPDWVQRVVRQLGINVEWPVQYSCGKSNVGSSIYKSRLLFFMYLLYQVLVARI